MKSLRSKKSINNNSSFISNHDLLQNFRNKSFKLITRENSTNNDFKQSNKKVNLIKKKSYQKIDLLQIKGKQKQKQNNINHNNLNHNHKSINNILNLNHNHPSVNNILNLNIKQTSKNNNLHYKHQNNLPMKHNLLNIQNKKTSRSIKDNNNDLNKITKQLNFVYDEINTDQVELRMILNKNIRKIKQMFDSLLIEKKSYQTNQQNSTETQYEQKICLLQQQIQQQYKIIDKLKIQNESLQEQIQFDKEIIKSIKLKLRKSKEQNKSILNNLQSPEKHYKSVSSFISPIQSKRNNQYVEQFNSKRYPKLQQKHNISVVSYEQKNKNLLEQIITSQTQLINKQTKQFQQENIQLYRVLKSQAETIQGFLFQAKIKDNIQVNNQKAKLNKQKHNSSSLYVNKTNNSSQRKDQFQSLNNRIINNVLTNPTIKNAEYSICLY